MGAVDQESKAVLFEVRDDVGIITLNRPKAYNALDLSLGDGLLEALIACDEDPGVRAVLITGNGSAFCSGGDIKQMIEHSGPDGAGAFLKTLTVRLHTAIATIVRMPKPVVAAVNGAAAGAGFSLALACDLVLAVESARFTVAYTAIALAPDGSCTHFLPRIVGPKRAFELMATNRAIPAREALSLGMVNEVLPDADFAARSLEYVSVLASGPTVALGYAKKLVTLSGECSIETQMEHERRAIAACGGTADFKEGAAAFFAKRKAVFRGR